MVFCLHNRLSKIATGDLEMPRTTAKGRVKNKKKYEALKRKGMSKTRAAKIANSGKKGSRKGGKHSHRGK